MIEERKDITLNEMVARLAKERGLQIVRSILNTWLRARGFTYKKDRICIGAGIAKPYEQA